MKRVFFLIMISVVLSGAIVQYQNVYGSSQGEKSQQATQQACWKDCSAECRRIYWADDIPKPGIHMCQEECRNKCRNVK